MTPQTPFVAPQMPAATQPIPQPSTRSSISSSNRDHIDQDAQTDIKKLRVINNSESDTATVEAQYSRTTGTPAKPMPNYQNNPIPGIDVVVQRKPNGGTIPTAKTDGAGQTSLRQLEPGIYDVALPTIPGGGTVSMTVFVNGTRASRIDFPVGSSIGTFTAAKAGDTIVLKFQTNVSTPSNGVGGTGGGRFTFK